MPLDSRRLPFPEDTKSPYFFSNNANCVKVDEELMLEKEDKQTYMKIGLNNSANGSSYMEIGKTKVICSVFGPREVTKREEFSMNGQIQCDFKLATFSGKIRRSHLKDNNEKEISSLIKQALEPVVNLSSFPKARVSIFILILEDDGNVLPASITCASLALANAGIEMYDIAIASTLLYVNDKFQFCSNTLKEKLTQNMKNYGSITISYLPSLSQISVFVQQGIMDSLTIKKGINLCIEECYLLRKIVNSTLSKSIEGKEEL